MWLADMAVLEAVIPLSQPRHRHPFSIFSTAGLLRESHRRYRPTAEPVTIGCFRLQPSAQRKCQPVEVRGNIVCKWDLPCRNRATIWGFAVESAPSMNRVLLEYLGGDPFSALRLFGWIECWISHAVKGPGTRPRIMVQRYTPLYVIGYISFSGPFRSHLLEEKRSRITNPLTVVFDVAMPTPLRSVCVPEMAR